MSTNLVNKKEDVHAFLQQSLNKSREYDKSLQLILDHMIQIESNVVRVEKDVETRFTQMTDMVHQVQDSVTLIYAEEKQLQSAVFAKSIQLTKDRFKEEDVPFNKVIGKHRRMIWSKLKRKFDVPRYNCIRRIDFQNALEFVEDFMPENYI